MSLEERIVIVATDEDKAALQALMQADGSASMSATVRKLIRQEAKRMGFVFAPRTPEKAERPERTE